MVLWVPGSCSAPGIEKHGVKCALGEPRTSPLMIPSSPAASTALPDRCLLFLTLPWYLCSPSPCPKVGPELGITPCSSPCPGHSLAGAELRGLGPCCSWGCFSTTLQVHPEFPNLLHILQPEQVHYKMLVEVLHKGLPWHTELLLLHRVLSREGSQLAEPLLPSLRRRRSSSGHSEPAEWG